MLREKTKTSDEIETAVGRISPSVKEAAQAIRHQVRRLRSLRPSLRGLMGSAANDALGC